MWGHERCGCRCPIPLQYLNRGHGGRGEGGWCPWQRLPYQVRNIIKRADGRPSNLSNIARRFKYAPNMDKPQNMRRMFEYYQTNDPNMRYRYFIRIRNWARAVTMETSAEVGDLFIEPEKEWSEATSKWPIYDPQLVEVEFFHKSQDLV